MSRIGKMPVAVPSGVNVTIKDSLITVKGPKGELKRKIPVGVAAKLEAMGWLPMLRPSGCGKAGGGSTSRLPRW